MHGEAESSALEPTSHTNESNSLQPIDRLPTELLELIFDTYVSSLIEDKGNSLLFIRWTHVCHTWRAIALSSPRLWRGIDFAYPNNLAAEFLVRSKEVPICVRVRPEAYVTTHGESVRRHAWRIRELRVLLDYEDMHDIATYLDSPLPILSTLALEVLATGVHDIMHLRISYAMPHLRVVDLRGVAIPWGVCVNLTSLSLTALSPSWSPSVPQLLAIITGSPALEHIKLVGFGPVANGAAVPHTPIELPHLRTLHFNTGSDLVLHILSCISVPSFATIQILNLTSSLAFVIPRHFQHLHNLSRNEEIILRLDPFRIELRRSRPVDHALSQTILQVAVSEMLPTTLLSLVGIFDMAKIATLELSGWQLGRITREIFRAFIVELTCITTLKAEYAGSEFFDILTRPLEEEAPPSADMICPLLTSVIVDRFINTDDIHLASLVNWLKERKQCGARLHRLEIYNCDVDLKWLNESRLLVDEMIIRETEETFPTISSRFRALAVSQRWL